MLISPNLKFVPEQDKALQWIRSSAGRLLIGGKWMPAKSGKTFGVFNPATEEHLCDVSEADKADVDAAVSAARSAFEASSWASITPHQRTRALLRIADAIERHSNELATIETLDNGMPTSRSSGSVAFAVELFRYYAGWPSKIMGTTNPTGSSNFIYTLREPLGVCAQIIPWNAPLIIAAGKIANALATGNTLVLKPAELAPLSSLRLMEIIQETDLPPGVVNILPGVGAIAGAALASHPDVDKVTFTGSTAVGRQVLQASAGNFKKVTLELGGKSPNIVFPDADMDRALQAAVGTFCGNSGQVCSAGTRLFVHESIRNEVSEKVSKIASTYKVGSPFAADTQLGPLISDKQLARVLGYINSGKDDGAKLALGGSRLSQPGYFIEPTVFNGVSNGMRIAQEEIFGPVLSIIGFKNEDDAVLQGNDSTYGLSAAIWTKDISCANRVARKLKAGRIWINTYGEADPVMPFGGYKQSGIGREFGIESIEAYTQVKSIMLRL